MQVKNIRVLTLITGELDEKTYKKLINPNMPDISTNILGLVYDQQIHLVMVGTEAAMYTCVSCGEMVDLDDDTEEEDQHCQECSEGPFCEDCLDQHICSDKDNED